MNERLCFASDYMFGAAPQILERLQALNGKGFPGYGTDDLCEAAGEKLRAACAAPEAGVYFLEGGTQTNAVVISALLRPWEGVLAPETGHINTHEAGAIEATGHKILPLPHRKGKLLPETVLQCVQNYEQDENRLHTVRPRLVYLTQPTEYGTLYTLEELRAFRRLCDDHELLLYVDGARLAYALGSPENDVTLPALASLCDVFYLGGTKCGALFGEAVISRDPKLLPQFFSQMKQRGAVLAKGWLLGLQFDTLLTDDLYQRLGQQAVRQADRLRAALRAFGYAQLLENRTNQVFPILTGEQAKWLRERVLFEYWETLPDGRRAIRLVTSWATTEAALDALIELLKSV